MENQISDKLKNSILERCCETPTGYLNVPQDLINRVRKETGSTDSNPILRARIQNFVNRHMR